MATYTVTTVLDELDIGTTFEELSTGGLSLRDAVDLANASAGADIITFDGTVFTGDSASLIRLTMGEIEITDAVTIDGSTATGVTITGDAAGDDLCGDDQGDCRQGRQGQVPQGRPGPIHRRLIPTPVSIRNADPCGSAFSLGHIA